MFKNLILLSVICFAASSYAKHPIVGESIANSEKFKVEKPVEEVKAQRAVAGARIKKQKSSEGGEKSLKTESDPDSEVRYWQYSE